MVKKKTPEKIIIGNWKMNPSTSKEAEMLFKGIIKGIPGIKKTEIVICPPYLYLEKLKKISLGHRHTGEAKKISFGAQNAFGGDVGAYTGEVSAEMLYNFSVKYVILGHSERRAIGENNNDINKKIKWSLSSGLIPIVCVGESIRDENHEYLNFVKTQIEECLLGISRESIFKVIIAYEPIWAIGKGALREATEEEFREMSIFIKKILSDKFGVDNAANVRIIYGGSVHPENALPFLEHGESDGFLVGRDSLNVKKFSEIIKICETLGK